jgi:predicted nucleic acid-binding protein
MRRFAEAERDRDKFVSALARVEASSAICRLRQGGRLNQMEAAQILNEITEETRQMNEQPITKDILDAAMALIDPQEIRTLDAIQLGSALVLRNLLERSEIRFIAADYRLLLAAQAEGFETWNPTVKGSS